MNPNYALPYLDVNLACPQCGREDRVIVQPGLPPFQELGYPSALAVKCKCGCSINYRLYTPVEGAYAVVTSTQ